MPRLYVTFLVYLLSLFCSVSSAQQVLSSAGGYSVAGEIALSYTVGQSEGAVYLPSGQVGLVQGFEQPNLLTVSVPEEIIQNDIFTLIPNPASENVLIRIPGNVHFEELTMVNHLGQVVYLARFEEIPLNDNQSREVNLSVSDRSEGVYHLLLRDGSKVYSSKFIKK